jgi:hypothetical protein
MGFISPLAPARLARSKGVYGSIAGPSGLGLAETAQNGLNLHGRVWAADVERRC